MVTRGGQPVPVPEIHNAYIKVIFPLSARNRFSLLVILLGSHLELVLLPLDEKELCPEEKPLRCLLCPGSPGPGEAAGEEGWLGEKKYIRSEKYKLCVTLTPENICQCPALAEAWRAD